MSNSLWAPLIHQRPEFLCMPERLRVFDLPRELPGTNQKIPSLRSQRLSGEKAYFGQD
jgi:hypothetical protein